MRIVRGSELDPVVDITTLDYLSPHARQALAALMALPAGRAGRSRALTGLSCSKDDDAMAELKARGHLVFCWNRYEDSKGMLRSAFAVYAHRRPQVRFPEDDPQRPARYRPSVI